VSIDCRKKLFAALVGASAADVTLPATPDQLEEVLVTARRKGNTWYLGGMSAKYARDLDLPLSFLGAGQYQIEVWKDAPDAETDPNHLATEKLTLSSKEGLKIHAAFDGGFVARLTPVAKGRGKL